MSAIRNKIQFPNRLDRLENEAKQHLAESENQWRLFVAKVQDIFKSKLWHEKTDDWNAYCKSEFGITAATIRQKAAQVPYAELIEATTGHSLTVSKIKALREIVEDKSIAVEYVYEVAYENNLTGDIPSTSDMQAAYEAIKESQSGFLEIKGSIVKSTPDAIGAKAAELIMDTQARRKIHIENNAKPKHKLSVTIQSIIVNGRLYAVLPENTPSYLIGKDVDIYYQKDES